MPLHSAISIGANRHMGQSRKTVFSQGNLIGINPPDPFSTDRLGQIQMELAFAEYSFLCQLSTQQKLWLSIILDSRDVDGLSRLLFNADRFARDQRLAVAIHSEDGGHTTVEFRHFQNTTDHILVEKWIRVIEAVAKTALCSSDVFQAILKQIAEMCDDIRPQLLNQLADQG
ncbi:hypothetical protein F4820DRAFT_449618 [Hypoxylon rubiginosum]|uniref:Uncharacterized protein n=1 Tax=Hypoxylon rubiginosum TaxID=110542 RepID=A0ACB9YWL7_9PEZI|nr:hypothetical protein F4820DRAFT_449618 [Hypoxylon rubiginosum]